MSLLENAKWTRVMPTVWIPNNSGHDFSAAERWGNLRFLTEGSINRFAVADMHRSFVPALAESEPEDYLLVTSLTIMNVVAAAILAAKHGRLNLLLFHNAAYIERRLVLSRVNNTLERDFDAELDAAYDATNLPDQHVCPDCGNQIDLTICNCGASKERHSSLVEGPQHPFIPRGCTCYARHVARLKREEAERSIR